MREAHTHVLAEKFQQSIIVFTANAYKNIVPVLYKPGLKTQTTITRHNAIKLMSGDVDVPVPMHLNYPHTHYSALVPTNATGIEDVDRSRRAKPGNANAPIALD